MNEEFERIKEEEKVHLRKLKELKQMLTGARRLNTTRASLDEMTSESERLLEENDALVRGLSQDAAIQDARMDMALAGEAERNAGAAQRVDPEEQEEELCKIRAQELIRQMKSQFGGAPDQSASSSTLRESPEAARIPSEKSIGRPPREPEQPEDPAGPNSAPEKTIGRMKP